VKLKILIGILVFLIVLNLATIGTFLFMYLTQDRSAVAERPFLEKRIGWRPGRSMHPMMRLDRQERQQLTKLLDDFHMETLDLRMQVDSLETQVIMLMHEEPVPTNEVDSLLERLSAIRLEISKKATKKLIEAKSFLSPEQREMFYKAILQVRPEPGGMRGPGLGGPRRSHMHRFQPDDSIRGSQRR
jgi:Spy/CpxP family protein refolding chaperone